MTETQLNRKLDRLKQTFLTLGPVLQGTILPRVIHREDPEHPERRKDYGPYYQWTRKVKGRTVLQNLAPAQAKTYARAIRENQKLEKIVVDIRATSLEMLELTTQGVPKRKPGPAKECPLS